MVYCYSCATRNTLNKMKLLKIALILSVFSLPFITQAQDKVYLKNGRNMLVKVIEIDETDVIYKNFDDQEGPKYYKSKREVIKIEMENGETYFPKKAVKKHHQKRNGIKFGVGSLLMGHIYAGYERSFNQKIGVEAGLAIIGLGSSSSSVDYGLGTRVSFKYKFMKSNTFGDNASSEMHGLYIRPELLTLDFVETVNDSYYGLIQQSGQTISALVNLGHQWAFRNNVLIDVFGGLGIGTSTSNNTNQMMIFFFENSPITYTLGVNVGFQF